MKPIDESNHALNFWEQLRGGGFTAAIIGMAGMVAKILLSTDPNMTWGKAVRHTLAAGIVAWLVNEGLREVQMVEGLKTACLGISGATATHIVDFVIEWVKARGQSELAKIKKPTSRGKNRKK